ncbi:cytosolic carboxypeptidase-like protein 5 [Macrobrachium nipponense]|uniref:cytosolic carboxypeptidase-like protein 5 n=1 Tax=Macrobrachium nipponense TaxID=159736 RepID=UPI0030C7B579
MEGTFGPFTFTSNFECGNLARVERVDPPGSVHLLGSAAYNPGGSSSSGTFGSGRKSHKTATNQPTPDALPVNYEFNLWTQPDCAGTEFENNNRTWFFFGIKGGCVSNRVRINVMNLNKQSKLFSQGMQPVMQCISGMRHPRWERIKDRCTYRSEENSTVISWVHTVSDPCAVTHYAFTYPYTYTELQTLLDSLDRRFPADCPSVYYHRELLVYSLDHWRVDLLTISSHKGKSEDREHRLPGLFPLPDQPRPFRFPTKKVVFVSARVHPGETSSSFVLNGFLNFILSNDPRAVKLRDLFVFKLIPILNPDGVVRGHYRTDQRGVNLNRVYVDPSPILHPTIYAARQIILYHHHGKVTPLTRDMPSAASTTESVSAADTASSSDADMSCKGPPVVMDEDTCHSFSDVQSGKAGGLASGRIKGASLMELDEPSASGWDISSNVSVDGTNTQSSSFQRGLQPSEVHDDCSNVSSISEAETGVTSMFGSMAAVSDFTDIISKNNRNCAESNKPGVHECTTEVRGVDYESSNKSRDLFVKDFHKEEKDKLGGFVGGGSEFEKGTLNSLGKDFNICDGVKPSRLSSATPSVLQTPSVMPYSSVSCTVSSQYFKAENASENKDLRVPTHSTYKRDVSSEKRNCGIPSTSHSLPCKGLSSNLNSLSSMPSTKEICGVASSSESEAECGRPGREAESNIGILDASLHLPSDAFSPMVNPVTTSIPKETQVSSGLFLYVDLHGHASKRGIFIYGNWYEDPAVMVENMLFPKLMAVNCPNFDFAACNFSERNMYLKDRRDGMSKEGSGRVAIMRATGLLRSYTLECNYNTGRTYNPTPPSPLDHRKNPQGSLPTPPKYNPSVFEDCGRQLGVSLLDLVGGGCNWSRIPQSQYGNLAGVRAWLHHFLTSSALSPRTQTTTPHTPRTPARTTNKLTVERLSSRNLGNGSRLVSGRPGPPSTPASPRLPRSRGQRVRRHSWCLTVDAENQEPQESSACPRPASAKKPMGSGSHSPRYKQKSPKIKSPPKKPGVSRSLTFTELGESSHLGSGETKLASSKINTCKHSLTANVSLTPNLSVKLSISDTPESPTLVKKVEKIRRQRSKGLNGGTKKLKISPSSSSSTEETSLKGKDTSYYSLPSLEATERKCSPLSASQEGFFGAAGQSPLSPRSPLSSVCEPQASHSPPGLGIITTSAPCEIHLQPKSPVVVTSPKKVPKVLSPSKRSSKHTLKSLSKSMDRLPAVPGAAGERLKLLPKKVKKKVAARSVTDLTGTIASPAMKPATSQPTLDWIISTPHQGLSSEIDTVPPKIKKRKKNSRKSL